MTEDQFEKLARLINDSHDDLSSRITELDYRMNEGFTDMRSELKTVNTRLDTLEEKVDGVIGVTKEIDYVLSEITTIKSYVGMTTEA